MINTIKWIKAKQELPKNKDMVLAFCCGTLIEAWFNGETWFSASCEFHKSAISHWARISKPKMPKTKHIPFVKGKAPMLMNGNFESFQSPLDGSAITCPAKLRAHNKKHGVTNIKDYSAGHFEKRGKEMQLEATGQTAEAKHERKQLIDQTLNRFGV